MPHLRWRKLGRVFDPTMVDLPKGCSQFAQAPQALVFDDFVRVYFSTRSVDAAAGKYLSHVAFVDMDKSLERVLRASADEVIPLGGLGCFDEHGIFPMTVIRHSGKVYGYTCGWSRRVSVSVETAIGLAVSEDEGQTFSRVGPGPVLGPSLHEPFLVGDGSVAVIGRTFHMWYIFGTAWSAPKATDPAERTYKIGHATSLDGVHWETEQGRQIVQDELGPDESQAMPSVVEIDGRYHMFFCHRQSTDFRTNPARGYRLGHAVSDNLTDWVRDDADTWLKGEPQDWDGQMQCYPHAFKADGNVFLLYNGNEFGRFGFGAAVLET
jgi:hypothetical protein